jgi:hypothetical protein
MIRLASVFWLLVASAAALATFAVKYEVQALDTRLADARKATAVETRELRVLDAEWAYLNRPDMLAAMNRRFLALMPIARKQLQTTAAEIPMRPAPTPPPTAPDPGSGEGSGAEKQPPEDAPVVTASRDRLAAPEKVAMAAPTVRAVAVKAAATPPPPSPRLAAVDSRSLDQLFARIATAR